jgi:hypothetical protein
MSQAVIDKQTPHHGHAQTNYLTNGHSIASWLLTKDHKRIAVLYLFSVVAMFFLGLVKQFAEELPFTDRFRSSCTVELT